VVLNRALSRDRAHYRFALVLARRGIGNWSRRHDFDDDPTHPLRPAGGRRAASPPFDQADERARSCLLRAYTGVGRVEGALARAAEDVYQHALNDEERGLAEPVFKGAVPGTQRGDTAI
jgi:hypothetical protein